MRKTTALLLGATTFFIPVIGCNTGPPLNHPLKVLLLPLRLLL
jgi:hypothetical protein